MKNPTPLNIQIDHELQNFIAPPLRENYEALEASIVSEGCREALIVWQKSEDEYILVDGHTRYKICAQHKIPYNTIVKKFAGIEEVRNYMVNLQTARRNETRLHKVWRIGFHYQNEKQNHSSAGADSTAEKLGEFYRIGEKTVRNYHNTYKQLLYLRSVSEEAYIRCFEEDLSQIEIDCIRHITDAEIVKFGIHTHIAPPFYIEIGKNAKIRQTREKITEEYLYKTIYQYCPSLHDAIQGGGFILPDEAKIDITNERGNWGVNATRAYCTKLFETKSVEQARQEKNRILTLEASQLYKENICKMIAKHHPDLASSIMLGNIDFVPQEFNSTRGGIKPIDIINTGIYAKHIFTFLDTWHKEGFNAGFNAFFESFSQEAEQPQETQEAQEEEGEEEVLSGKTYHSKEQASEPAGKEADLHEALENALWRIEGYEKLCVMKDEEIKELKNENEAIEEEKEAIENELELLKAGKKEQQVSLPSLIKMKNKGLCILKQEGETVLEFMKQGDGYIWADMGAHDSQNKAKKELARLFESKDHIIKLNF